MFDASAAYYDLFYHEKDYRTEADYVAAAIRDRLPTASTLLDVACGTAEHARFLVEHHGFAVDGIDIEPRLLKLARTKVPSSSFHVADMIAFDLGRSYDAVACLFSSIGYARTETNLRRAVAAMARHLAPGGVLLIEPWFEPGAMTHGLVTMLTAETPDGTKACRMSHTTLDGRTSRIRFEYLLGDEHGLRRETELHELGLFTREEMVAAFRSAGLSDIEYDEDGPSGRGMCVATSPS